MKKNTFPNKKSKGWQKRSRTTSKQENHRKQELNVESKGSKEKGIFIGLDKRFEPSI